MCVLSTESIYVLSVCNQIIFCLICVLQTFGGKNMKRVGVILQRSILILLLFCLPCWGFLINSHNLLLILHQEEEVARYIHSFINTLYHMCVMQTDLGCLRKNKKIHIFIFIAMVVILIRVTNDCIFPESVYRGILCRWSLVCKFLYVYST